jgi:hypothetical protein
MLIGAWYNALDDPARAEAGVRNPNGIEETPP